MVPYQTITIPATVTSFSGYANLALNSWNTQADGKFTITSDKTHKIEFGVDPTSGVKIEYNDKLRAETTTLTVQEALKEFALMTENNLLYLYLEDFLPLINYISGIADSLEFAPLDPEKVIFSLLQDDFGVHIQAADTNKIKLTLDIHKIKNVFGSQSNLLNLQDYSSEISLLIDLDPHHNNAYLGITFLDVSLSGKTGDITTYLSLGEHSSSISWNNGVGTIDLNDLPTLLRVGITCTERKSYKISGKLTAKTSGIASWFVDVDVDADVDCYLQVGQTVNNNKLYDVSCLIDIRSYTNESSATLKTSQTREYINTRVNVYEQDAYIKRLIRTDERTRRTIFSSWSSYAPKKYNYEYQKMSRNCVINNLLYFIIDYALNQPDLYNTINGFIQDNGNTSSTNIEDFIKSFGLKQAGIFELLLSIYSIINVYADILYNTTSYDLAGIHVYTNFNILIASISLDFNATNDLSATEESIKPYIDEFDAFIYNFENNEHTKDLKFRESLDDTGSEYIYNTSTNIF